MTRRIRPSVSKSVILQPRVAPNDAVLGDCATSIEHWILNVMREQIAVVGAGIAGLAAAHRLRHSGFRVSLFDKSHGVGGRMATRRVDVLEFDHGAQYFTAKGARFRAALAHWQSSGLADEWFDGAFVGTPDMTAPARAMAEEHNIASGCQVTALRHEQGHWKVYSADGLVKTRGNGRFAAVILALPAPQAEPLAASAGVIFPEFERVRYAPCWALMLAFSGPLTLPNHQGKQFDDVISWIARNSSKPGRKNDNETVIVHATPDWSRRNLERSPFAAARELTARFQFLTGVREQPCFSAAHRWRYAFVEETAGVAFLWDSDKCLGACGDWCIGPRIEAAFDSGEAMAEVVLKAQEASLVV